ncbi:MAG: RecX family transcriptional regulator [Dehalococcoidales bacterium]|nr:MAG: RecX family transcriptional regulator [Dehalococcoidales bacterium]
MVRITAIRIANRSGQNSGKRANVFLDSQFTFTLETEAVVKQGLQVGQELSASQIKALTREGYFYRGLNAATRFLSYRPRSESELRKRLNQRGFESDIIEMVIARLKEQGFVDDVAFAQFWKENRDTFSPRSRWLTGLELRRQGVAADIINTVVGDIDDNDSAYRAASSRVRRLPLSDYQAFRRHLGDYLKRRGFSYGVIADTVRRLWQELEQEERTAPLER